MSDEQAFLQAILENPDDDQLRLVYADWLEERGDPRAEFIRVQLALANGQANGLQRKELVIRQHELLAIHQGQWLGRLRQVRAEVQFQRGFPELVRLDAAVFLEHAESLFQSAPIRSVQLSGVRPVVHDLAEAPVLAKVRGLDLAQNGLDLDPSGLATLVSSPHLAGLQELKLDWNFIELSGVRELARAPYLRALSTLSLGNNSIGDLAVQALANSPHLPQLRVLGLGACELTPTAVSYLVRSSLLQRLTLLDLSNNRLGNDGLRALVKARHIRGLESLRLNSVDVNSLGVASLAASPHLVKLKALSLQGNHITDVGAEGLAASRLDNVTELNLLVNPINCGGRAKLRARFGDKVHLDI